MKWLLISQLYYLTNSICQLLTSCPLAANLIHTLLKRTIKLKLIRLQNHLRRYETKARKNRQKGIPTTLKTWVPGLLLYWRRMDGLFQHLRRSLDHNDVAEILVQNLRHLGDLLELSHSGCPLVWEGDHFLYSCFVWPSWSALWVLLRSTKPGPNLWW